MLAQVSAKEKLIPRGYPASYTVSMGGLEGHRVIFIDSSQLCSCVHSFSSSRDDASAERSTLSALAHVRGAWKSGILDPAPAPRSKQLPADRRSPSPFLTRAPAASCSLEFRD